MHLQKNKVSANLPLTVIPCTEKAAFRNKMKSHYKNEFSAGTLLRHQPLDEDLE